jgi:hypothetical protein
LFLRVPFFSLFSAFGIAPKGFTGDLRHDPFGLSFQLQSSLRVVRGYLLLRAGGCRPLQALDATTLFL